MPKATRSKSATSQRNEANAGEEGNASGSQQYPAHHPYAGRECIVVHDHDVLNGRGVNMAHHPGNERFRALIQSRSDPSYCSSYTLNEKKALAEEIVRHIEELDPPGRFLKRSGKTKNKRGLQGPWEIMSREESIKKARQALRDCNRPDRDGYAKSVAAPVDVVESVMQRNSAGLTQQEYVQQLVAANPPPSTNAKEPSSGRSTPNSTGSTSEKKPSKRSSPSPSKNNNKQGALMEAESESWIPEKVVAGVAVPALPNDPSEMTPLLRNTTPTTAATSAGVFSYDAEDFAEDAPFHQHHALVDVTGAPSLDSPTHSSQFVPGLSPDVPPGAFEEALAASLQDDDDDVKPRAVSSFQNTPEDPLQEEADAAALASAFEADGDFLF